MKLFDAHNHLQDQRFHQQQKHLLDQCKNAGIVRSVVNGTCEKDWDQVTLLARENCQIIPGFGYHPWYLSQASRHWRERLINCLDAIPSNIGEIGLDRWKPGLDLALQERFFIAQLEIAAERGLPVSIHCLDAWGWLLEILSKHPLPAPGFLVHSYSGSVEMIAPLAKLGAYFSCSGSCLTAQKVHKLSVFKHVPRDRLLVETDAPDQCLPEELDIFLLKDPDTARRINHPANLAQIYQQLSSFLQVPSEEFASCIENNFNTLFGK